MTHTIQKQEHEVPFIVNGEEKNDYRQGQELEYGEEGEVKIYLPSVEDEDLAAIADSDPDLHHIDLDEIISFYSELGNLWSNRNYSVRQEAVQRAEEVTGYDREMIEQAYDQFASFLHEDNLREMLEGDLEGGRVLEEWVDCGNSKVHMQPHGRILHLLASNAPPIGPLSMVRGNITKNSNMIKLGSGDPITPAYFARSFQDVDPDHPLTKSTSVLYWPHDSKAEDAGIDLSDGIVVWGGRRAVEGVRNKADAETELIEFGPGRGLQLIGEEVFEDEQEMKRVADAMAKDVAAYDQEACFSPQVAFVEGDAEKFSQYLADSMERMEENMPKGKATKKEKASVSQEKAISNFSGDTVLSPGSTEWTVIVTDELERTIDHPRGRTLYLHQVGDLEAAESYIDDTVNTIGIYPQARKEELRDKLTLKGADKISDVGRMGEKSA